MSQYEHTQRAPLHFFLLAGAALFAVMPFFSLEASAVRYILWVVAGVFVFLSVCFAQLVVRDDDEFLIVRFGPLPAFGTRIPWSRIQSAEATRSSAIDGWGIHWVPGRGTTFNLWGFDCVALRVNGKTVRVGSDDAETLASYINEKLVNRTD